MTTVKTKEEFQAKQKQLENEFRAKPKNPNHIVRPNLTPRGRDIIMRLQNKSLDTEGNRQYTLNEDIVNARNMNIHELRAAAAATQNRINSLKESLEANAKKAEQPKSKDDASTNG